MLLDYLVNDSVWTKTDYLEKVQVFGGKHIQDWAEIAENEQICGFGDNIRGVRFFWATCPIRFCISEPNGMLGAFYF